MSRFDPLSLRQELAALPIVGCRSDTRRDQDGTDDVTQIIDWSPSHPTPAERATAQAILAAHDPNRRKREQAVRAARIAAIETKIKAGTETTQEIREHRRLGIELRDNGGIL